MATEAMAGVPSKFRKTGTTIVGVLFEGGVALCSDTRATAGNIVVDKNCLKQHYIADNVWCLGAGTAADTEAVTMQISHELRLLQFETGRVVPVTAAITAMKRHLWKYQGHVSAALICGGVDSTGAHLSSVWPHGSTDSLPFLTMGSGCLAALSVLERGWRRGLTKEEGVSLGIEAVKAGIFNDMGSGSNVDVVIIDGEGTERRRNTVKPGTESRGADVL
ncbi:peptidase T1A, proteasome beta-subunit [Kipferlia bialata]|uniref:Proteasome subunit beta n=1 Tax=Kipferlia bialata TaxID=797122 RepID=A0A9K3DAL9_9EUKA|nr:peptidase T1A, proteasome beta-subunit [Kipferlia bialata]|eukprot:g13588.t1